MMTIASRGRARNACAAVAAALFLTANFASAQQPAWAYAINPAPPAAPPATRPPPDPTPQHRPGSSAEFTRAQITNMFAPADWYPGDHPPMPDVVAKGRMPAVRRCSFCHYPNGKGRPENAGVAGLPPAYFVQTLKDFASGARKSSEPRKANTNGMIAIAKGMTEDEMKQAAEYFGSMKWTPWVKVVETNTVPKTRLQGMYMTLPGDEKEPIGNRIIETPVDAAATQLFDSRSSFIAYVPVGSVKKGEALVTQGMGKTTQCGLCHGADLRGLGPVPGLAGRSASYVARQMYDMQQGARKGIWTEMMKPVVANLNDEDILNIAAYTVSLAP
jgi:cytochrome c553